MMQLRFEGVEERLELSFSITHLRKTLTKEYLEEILEPVDCKIEGSLSEINVDAYLLSASSLFVYDDVLIIKTCGETKIFECLQEIMKIGGQNIKYIQYTRGEFFMPEAQPIPHHSVDSEFEELKSRLAGSSIMNFDLDTLGTASKWHFINGFSNDISNTDNPKMCIELCMYDLDRDKASVFYKKSEDCNTMTNDSVMPLFELSFDGYEGTGRDIRSVGNGRSVMYYTF